MRDGLIAYLFTQSNETKRKNQWRHIQRFCFSVVTFPTLRIEKTKIGITDHILISLFCLWIRKREKEMYDLFPIFYYGIGKRKTKGRHIQQLMLFCFFWFFSSCKGKNENMYNGSYFYFLFFVCWLGQGEMILSYPFPIFYDEIEKRKTKGRYIHGPIYPSVINDNIRVLPQKSILK